MITDATQDVSSVGAKRRTPRAPMVSGDTQSPSAKPQSAQSPTAAPAQPQTFAQMQAAGQARPAPPQAAPVQPGQVQGALASSVTDALNRGGSRYALPEVQQVRSALQGDLERQFTGKQKQLDEEMARRGIGASSIAGGYMGDLAGQHASALANLDADLIRDAAATNAQDQSAAWGAGAGIAARDQQADQFNLSHALNERLGVGGLDLQGRALDQEGSQFDRSLDQQSSQFGQNIGLQREQMAQSGSQFDRTFGLSAEIQRGNMSLAQASQALQERVQTGQLSLAQAQQALAELNNSQQFGLQQRAQQTQAEQFAQQLAQQLGLAQMGDRTANRGIDANARLAENELYLRVAQMLAGMGYPVNTPPGNTPPGNTPPTPDPDGNPIGDGAPPAGDGPEGEQGPRDPLDRPENWDDMSPEERRRWLEEHGGQ